MAEVIENRPAVPEGTFMQRMNEVAEDARSSKIASMTKKKEIFISNDDKEIARQIIYLMDDDKFKAYLNWEAKEIGDRMIRAFEDVPDAVLKTGSFGEKMAFNKGRLYQMEYFKRIRDNLISRFLESSKIEKEKV